MAGVNRVTSLCGDMRYLGTLIAMLKEQVQELGSRDVNLDAAIDFTEQGLHILVNKGAPVLKNRARHFDRDVVEGPMRCDHSFRRPQARQRHERRSMRGVFGQLSWAHSDASSWAIQASAHVAGRFVREAVHVPAKKLHLSKFSGERVRQRVKAFWCEDYQLASGSLRAVGFCESPMDIRRGKMGVANVFQNQLRPLQLMVQRAQKEASKLLLQLWRTQWLDVTWRIRDGGNVATTNVCLR